MEWKTVVIFLLALIWSFVRNYERKPRKVNTIPVPAPKQYKGDVSPKMSQRQQKVQTVQKKPVIIQQSRAANPVVPASSVKKGGVQEYQTTTELPEEQQNDLAEVVRFKLRTQNGAREAFILNEIFQKRV